MEQTKELRLTQGEIIAYFSSSGRPDADELAKLMGYNSYTYYPVYTLEKINYGSTRNRFKSPGCTGHFNPKSVDELAEIVHLNKTMIAG